MRRIIVSCASLATVLLASAAGAGAASAADPSTGTNTTFTGNTGIPGATVYLEVEQATSPDADGVPTQLTDTVVATTRADANGGFVVALPDTPVVRDAAIGGWINTVTVARAGRRIGVHQDSALVSTTANTSLATDAVALGAPDGTTGNAVHEDGFVSTSLTSSEVSALNAAGSSADTAAGPDIAAQTRTTAGVVPEDNTQCYWYRVAKTSHGSRVGELHVANVTGAHGKFMYAVRADSHFTVGFRYSSADDWSVDGHATVDNAISSGGGFSRGAGFRGYAADSMDYGKFHPSGVPGPTCVPGSEKIEALRSSGDAYVSTVRTPSAAPWPSCHADPYTMAIISPHGGYYYNENTHAANYGLVANLWGFQFGGRTGYTSNIKIKLTNDGSKRTYACGTKDLPGVPILYNKSW